MNDLKVVEIRKAAEGDMSYIFDTWLEDFLSSHYVTFMDDRRGRLIRKPCHISLMPNSLYYKEQREKIQRILAKSDVLVACNAEDESQIFGYIVHRFLGVEIGIVSWIYVRPIYRKLGICNKLMERVGTMDVVTHLPPKSKWFPQKYNLVFNPYMEDKYD